MMMVMMIHSSFFIHNIVGILAFDEGMFSLSIELVLSRLKERIVFAPHNPCLRFLHLAFQMLFLR